MHTDRFEPLSILRRASLAALVGVLACAVDLTPPPDPTAARPGPVITVSAAHLSWTTDSVVRYTIANPDAAPIYWKCPLKGLQYYRDGWRATAWNTDAGCVANGGFIALAGGDSLVASHRLTNDLIPQAGWYRFIFWLYREPSPTSLWDESSRVSPSFYVGP